MPEDAVVPVRVSDGSFDPRVITEYDGTADVVEWWSRSEMLCNHRGADAASVLPLRLTGGAFAVWAQLTEKERGSLETVRTALFAAFALDQYAAYDAFCSRRLQPGESADVYLADLKRLATLFGGVPDRALTCAFVTGLPDAVRQAIRAGSRAEALDLAGVVARARAVLSDDRVAAGAAAAPGEIATRRQSARAPRRQRERRCWTCGKTGHYAAACPGNGLGGGASAPVPAPDQ